MASIHIHSPPPTWKIDRAIVPSDQAATAEVPPADGREFLVVVQLARGQFRLYGRHIQGGAKGDLAGEDQHATFRMQKRNKKE